MKFLGLIFLSFIVGCSTTADAMNKISTYYNRSADDFFRNNGMPVQVYQYENGERVYRWSSVARSIYMPAVTTYSGNISPQGQVYGSAQTTGGYTANLQCVLDIETNIDNKIVKIIPIIDTWGSWETSRCNETLR